LEEVFYRSFLYRYCVRTDFQNMPMNQFHHVLHCDALLFGFVHFQWIGAFGGMILQGCPGATTAGRRDAGARPSPISSGLWIYWKAIGSSGEGGKKNIEHRNRTSNIEHPSIPGSPPGWMFDVGC